jgi:hypothetical protein
MSINDTVFEEAKRCPKCGVPGKPHSQQRPKNGNGMLHFFECEQKGCRNFGNPPWMVQVARDGSIPVRDTKLDKDFPKLDTRHLNSASSQIDRVLNPPTDDEGGEWA